MAGLAFDTAPRLADDERAVEAGSAQIPDGTSSSSAIRTKSKQSLQILNRSEPLQKTADMDVEAVWAAKAYPSMAGYHACTVDAAPQPVEGA